MFLWEPWAGQNEKMEWKRRENGFEDSASKTLLTLPAVSVNHNCHLALFKKKKAKEKRKEIKRAYINPKTKCVSQAKTERSPQPICCVAA